MPKDLEAVRALARELDMEPEHCFHVCATALSLFDQTRELHGLDDAARDVLEAAALLHDTGYAQGVRRHHKFSRDIILGLTLPGFSETEQRMTACVARYHRKAAPREDHAVYRELTPDQQTIVRRLAAILRIADGLDRLHVASVQAITVVRKDTSVMILARQRRPSPTDIWGGLRKTALFSETFGVRVDILPEEEGAA